MSKEVLYCGFSSRASGGIKSAVPGAWVSILFVAWQVVKTMGYII